MPKFSENPDFENAVKTTLRDILDGKIGTLNLSYPFNADTQEGHANAVEVIDYIHNNNFLLNFNYTLGSGMIPKNNLKMIKLSPLGEKFLEN